MKPAPQRLDDGKALRPSSFVRRQISTLKLAPASSVLDVPCGTGRHSLYLGRLGHHVTVVDVDEALVQATVARLQASQVECTGIVADATMPLPFEPAIFDIAIITDFVDEHLLGSIGNVIRTGGHLIYESYLAQGGNWLQLLPPGRSAEILEPMFEILRSEKREVGPSGFEAESIKILARRR